MKDKIVIDIETKNTFADVGGNQNIEKLETSLVGIYSYNQNKYLAFRDTEIDKVGPILQNASLIIGFSIVRFDLPVLAPYLFTPIENLPVLDLIDAVEKHRGHRASLDSIAQPTLRLRKSGTGFDALTLFQEGRMEELKRYCLDDVRLTKEVYDYGRANGKIYFTSSWDYKTYEIPVSWREETEEFLRSTKPSNAEFPTSLF